MVDFTLTDEQKALQEMAHEFAEKEIRPVAWEYDVEGTWPQEIIDKAWELGIMNNHLPEEYGGPGASYLEGALIEEEISWGCSGIGTSVGANGLAAAPVLIGGSVVGTWGEPFVKGVESEIRARARLDFTREVELVEASLGSYGVLVGAAALVRHRLDGES
jgi:alkylation response protein AidB-like acyl-CoA dehydrogenase